MEVNEANKIIEKYKKSISRGTEGGTVLRRSSWLPCSKGRIKYAYFMVIENIIESKGALDEKLEEDLVESYSLLNSFVDDVTADKYVKIYNDWQSKKSDFNRNKKDEMLAKQYINYTFMLKGDDLEKELRDYVKELLRSK